MQIKLTNAISYTRKKLLIVIMRTFIFLFCFTVLGFTPNNIVSQNEKIEIHEDQIVTVDQVFDIIKSQTDYRFIYPTDLFKDYPKVELKKGIILINDLLNKSIVTGNYKFKYSNNRILISEKKEVFQQIVSGIVTDQNDVPLAGVNVLAGVDGDVFKRGVATDFDGKYSIEIFDGETISFSYVGFITQTLVYEGQSTINIKLVEAKNTLDEIVINTGYQKISKERSTGSASVMKLEDLKDQRTSDNILTMIEGSVPGLVFTEDQFSGRQTLELRGNVNLQGGGDPTKSEPLIVVDGFPLGGGFGSGNQTESFFNVLERFNPEDIENVTVLRDAAAASIWGARAGNGVIVITTKRGKRNQEAEFTATSSLSFTQMPDYNDANLMSTQSYLEWDKIRVDLGRIARFSPFFLSTATNTEGSQAYIDFNNGAITQEELDNIIAGLSQNNMIKEYEDLFLRTSIKNRQTLTMSQGGSNYNLYASFNYDNELSNTIGDERRRMIGNVNISADVAKGVTIGGRINYSNQKNQNNGIDQTPDRIPLYRRFLDDAGNYVLRPGYLQEYLDLFEARGGVPYDLYRNEKREVDNTNDTRRLSTLDVLANINIDLFKGLSFEGAYVFQDRRTNRDNIQNEETWFTRSQVSRSGIYYDHDGDFSTPVILDTSQQYDGFVFPKGYIYEKQNERGTSSGGRAQFNYSGFLDKEQKHYFTGIAGLDYREENYEREFIDRLYGYNPRTLTRERVFFDRYTDWTGRDRTVGFLSTTPFTKVQDRYLSNYFNGSYTYDGKYTVSGSWRLDDANLFGSSSDYRNIPLWSVGAKWQIAKETFLSDSKVVSQLDLRASRGTGGNIQRGTNPFLTITEGQDFTTQVPYAYINTLANDQLRWETNTTLNLGLDFALFNRKLSGSFDWYKRVTSDLLGNQNVNPTNGIESQLRNYAEVSNKGFDIVLNYRPFQNDNFSWDLTGILNHNINKIERLDNNFDNVFARVAGTFIEGETNSAVWAYRWAGLDENGAPQTYDINGDINTWDVDLNQDFDNIEYQGQRAPKYVGSLRNSVRFKNFTLQALMSFQFGHIFRRASVGGFTIYSTSGTSLHKDFERRWQEPGDENFTNVPAITSETSSNYWNDYLFSDVLIEKADHIRLTSVSLNYDFTGKWLERTFIDGIRLGINGQNLGLIWTANGEGIDPIVGNREGFLMTQPTYSFNARINF